MAIDQQKLNKEYIFTGRGTAAELMGEMGRVAVLEKRLKVRVFFIRCLGVLVALLLAASAIKIGKFGLILGLVAGAIVFIYAGTVASRIIHDRVEFLRLMLNMLSQDCGKKGRFQVRLQLHGQRERVSEGPGRHGRSDLRLFRDPWLTFDGRLRDGTAISASCADLIRQHVKKNPRGKTKTKERRACLLRVALDYNSAWYGDAVAAAHGIKQPFRLPDGAEMKAFIPTGKALAMKTVVKNNPAAASLHAAGEAMMLGAYRILNHSRQRHVLAGGGGK